MIEKFTDTEKEELLKELLEWKEKLNKEREKELEDNAMANLKSNAKIIFDKFPEVDKIQLTWCGKAYDAPYESFCNTDIECIPVKDGIDYLGQKTEEKIGTDNYNNLQESYEDVKDSTKNAIEVIPENQRCFGIELMLKTINKRIIQLELYN